MSVLKQNKNRNLFSEEKEDKAVVVGFAVVHGKTHTKKQQKQMQKTITVKSGECLRPHQTSGLGCEGTSFLSCQQRYRPILPHKSLAKSSKFKLL